MAETTLTITLPFFKTRMTATVNHRNEWVVRSDGLNEKRIEDWKIRFKSAAEVAPIVKPVYRTSMSEEYASRALAAYEGIFLDAEISDDTSWDDLRITDDEVVSILL